MLLLTEGPHLYYVDPAHMELKGQIPWSKQLRPEAKNFRIFFVHTVSLCFFPPSLDKSIVLFRHIERIIWKIRTVEQRNGARQSSKCVNFIWTACRKRTRLQRNPDLYRPYEVFLWETRIINRRIFVRMALFIIFISFSTISKSLRLTNLLLYEPRVSWETVLVSIFFPLFRILHTLMFN